MWHDSTRIVEITGVFGAGFLPGMLRDLKEHLENNFRRRVRDGTEMLKVICCLDNDRAQKTDSSRRKTIDDLIKRRGELSQNDIKRLEEGLKWTDQIVSGYVQNFPAPPFDIVLRRGGVLQAWTHFRNEEWRTFNSTRIRQPDVMIFLTASLPLIKLGFENSNVDAIRSKNKGNYCNTPERAFEVQEEWLSNIYNNQDGSGYRSLVTVERVTEDKTSTAEYLVPYLQRQLLDRGLDIIPWSRVFISHSLRDSEFVKRIKDALECYYVDCWVNELGPGDRLPNIFETEIKDRDFVILVVSRNSLASPAVATEVKIALECEESTGQTILVPIRIDQEVLETSSDTTRMLKGRKFIGDFTKLSDKCEFDKNIRQLIDKLSEFESDRMRERLQRLSSFEFPSCRFK